MITRNGSAGAARALWGVAFACLWLASLYSYLLFHSLVELFTILVAWGIFIVAWHSRRIVSNDYLLFIGISGLFVGVLDLLHTLAYNGMGTFPGYGDNLAYQLWTAARYLQSSALLAAPLFLSRPLNGRKTLWLYMAATAGLAVAIFSGTFPDSVQEGTVTTFGKMSEVLVFLMLSGAMIFLRKRSGCLDRDMGRLLLFSIMFLLISEAAFALFGEQQAMVGHLMKFVASILLYKAMIEIGLMRPYRLLFQEVKVTQEEVEILNTELAARAASLQQVNRELEAANQDLEAFNYTVSHDLRGPLSTINGYCQLLMISESAGLDDESLGYLRKIWEGGVRMDQLISTLLDFSRFERHAIEREDVDLSEVVEQVATELMLREPGRRVSLAAQEGVRVKGDPRLLRVLMENLLGNAWKYTGNRPEAVVEFGDFERDGGRCCYVRDNGAGFDMQQADRLFLPFQRLHDKEEFEGTGIGLATVKRIVDRHGGRIWAEGEPGKGSIFFFTLEHAATARLSGVMPS